MKYAIPEWEMRETRSDPCLSSRSASAKLWLLYASAAQRKRNYVVTVDSGREPTECWARRDSADDRLETVKGDQGEDHEESL